MVTTSIEVVFPLSRLAKALEEFAGAVGPAPEVGTTYDEGMNEYATYIALGRRAGVGVGETGVLPLEPDGQPPQHWRDANANPIVLRGTAGWGYYYLRVSVVER